jgi:hypothetical protein
MNNVMDTILPYKAKNLGSYSSLDKNTSSLNINRTYMDIEFKITFHLVHSTEYMNKEVTIINTIFSKKMQSIKVSH